MNNKNTFRNFDETIPGLNGRTVGEFWRWAYSDILSNRNRAILAEFIVGVALGPLKRPRVEWDASDLCYRGRKVEVKSAAYVQGWPQKRPSDIRFGFRKAIPWDAATGDWAGRATRSSDIYVFCLFAERDRSAANVLNIPAWDFYVAATDQLSARFGEAKSLSLGSVKQVAVSCKFEALRSTVDAALPDRAG